MAIKEKGEYCNPELQAPLGLRIVPTYRCNMSCEYCYQGTFRGSVLSLDDLEKSLNALPNTFYPIYLTFHGGEISSLPRAIDLIRLTKKRFPHSKFSVTTNGTGPIAFYQWCLRHGIHLTFSDHGHLVEKGAFLEQEAGHVDQWTEGFAKTLQSLQGIRTAGIRLNLYWESPLEHLTALYRLCRRDGLGLSYCHDLMVEEKLSTESILKKLSMIDPEIMRYQMTETAHHLAFESDDFTFWFYRRSSERDRSEWIILPNGSLSNRLADLKEGVGASVTSLHEVVITQV